jgi:hypothetical protein
MNCSVSGVGNVRDPRLTVEFGRVCVMSVYFCTRRGGGVICLRT